MKYPDDEIDEDSNRDNFGQSEMLEEKFQHAAFLGQEWDVAMIEAGETPLGPNTEEEVLKVAALTPHDKVCDLLKMQWCHFTFFIVSSISTTFCYGTIPLFLFSGS